PLTFGGETAPGLMFIADTDVLLVEADVLHIPEDNEVCLERLEDDTVVTAADVVLPEHTTLVADPESPIVSISEPQVDEEVEAAAEAAEEGGAEAGAESSEEAATEE